VKDAEMLWPSVRFQQYSDFAKTYANLTYLSHKIK